MMNDLISVIIPVYRVEEYIRKCLDSIVSQTYQELEIILVDDGSPDNCGMICDEYAERDNRVKVIHKSNGGLSSARNAALDVIKGNWVICVDSDDYVHPDMIRRLHEVAVCNSAQISICAHYEERGDKLLITQRVYDDIRIWDKKTALEKLVEDNDIKSYAWGKLYKAELFDGVRYPDGRNYEDIATTYFLFDKADKIVKIPDYLYYYLIRKDSISFNDSPQAWHKGCHASCLGQEERAEYFKSMGYTELYALSMSKLLPYLFSDIRSGYSSDDNNDVFETKDYLQKHLNEFNSNPYISGNDKKIIRIYLKDKNTFRLYLSIKGVLKKSLRNIRRIRKKIISNNKKYNFSLEAGRNKRIVYFELPCFDNLGDHAIAYVTERLLRAICADSPSFQVFVVEGWDTDDAILSLKRVAGPDDIIICQGGGNFGNLYDFAEVFRRKVLRSFKNNRIIIMPQTLFYSDDESGKRECEADKRAIKDCRDITIFARDKKSYELMRELFDADICQLHDVVSLYDASYLSNDNRSGIVVCLRSDKESALSGKEKIQIIQLCENNAERVIVTDTCTKYDIASKEREAVLKKKLSLFGSTKLVVTDRLHGMIFSVITKTPCIVLGNNHHKVYETYRTFKDFKYIRYIGSVEELERALNDMKDCCVLDGIDFSGDIEQLKEHLRLKMD